jgi:hypothetical protein
MKKLAVLSALVLFGLTGCADTVTRRTSSYQQTSSNVPAETVVAPGSVLNDDGTATTTKTTKRVEKSETN